MLRFLTGLIDDHISLTRDERKAVHREVQLMFSRERWSTLVRMIPGFIPLLLIPVWQYLRKNHGLLWDAVAEVLFAALYLAFLWWYFRFMYRRYARRAIRTLGLADICPRCGYDLAHQPAESLRCPECGARYETMPKRTEAELPESECTP